VLLVRGGGRNDRIRTRPAPAAATAPGKAAPGAACTARTAPTAHPGASTA